MEVFFKRRDLRVVHRHFALQLLNLVFEGVGKMWCFCDQPQYRGEEVAVYFTKRCVRFRAYGSGFRVKGVIWSVSSPLSSCICARGFRVEG